MGDPWFNKHVDDLSYPVNGSGNLVPQEQTASKRQGGQSINFIGWIFGIRVQKKYKKMTASSPDTEMNCLFHTSSSENIVE